MKMQTVMAGVYSAQSSSLHDVQEAGRRGRGQVPISPLRAHPQWANVLPLSPTSSKKKKTIYCIFYFFTLFCVGRERGPHVLWCRCGGEEMTGKSPFSPSTTWTPKIKLRSSSFAKECIYPLGHVASPMPYLLKVPFHPNGAIGWDNTFNTWTLGERLRVKP